MARILLLALAILFLHYPVQASDEPPNFRDWTVKNISRIELRISDRAVAYLGFETEYSNPNDPTEFAEVIDRHIPLIVAKKKYNQRQFVAASISSYVDKEEQDRLRELSKMSDTFIVMRWKVKKDPRTGNDLLDGNMNIWFMPANGKWFFVENGQVSVEFLTENIGNGKSGNVFSGMRFKLFNNYHLLKVDRSDIMVLEGGQ